MNKVILFLLIASLTLSAQKNKSIHSLEHEYYSHKTQIVQHVSIPVHLKKNNSAYSNDLKKTVFGFLPWWEYIAGSHQKIRYDLLSHIAISFFDTDENGNIIEPPAWPWNDLLDSARTNSVKMIMSVSNFDSGQIHKLLTEQTSKQNLFNNILEKITTYGFNGVNIDFENLLNGDESGAINGFMNSLATFLKSINTQLEISFDSPVVNFGGWDFKELANACDYLFIMGYDFYGSWSTTTGPSSPLTGGNYNITKSLNGDYKDVPPEKLILGLPYYGNYWKTNSKTAYASVTPYDSTNANNNWVQPALRYKDITAQYASKEKMWDAVSQTPWLRWGQDTTWNQIWYDDESSLSLKYDLTILKNLKGIGIWALGYDNGRNELWDLIRNKFTQQTNVEFSTDSLPDNFNLHQNYPNPFNPETVISYQLSVSSYVSLKVFDLLGREVATLVNEVQSAGIYYSMFSTLHKPLTSGVYIYSLRTNVFSRSKKMVLLK